MHGSCIAHKMFVCVPLLVPISSVPPFQALNFLSHRQWQRHSAGKG